MSRGGRAVGLCVLMTMGGTSARADAPWEVWRDLKKIADLPVRNQVLLRSSYCPDGCRFDRHSDGDTRFLYTDGEEGVIFDFLTLPMRFIGTSSVMRCLSSGDEIA